METLIRIMVDTWIALYFVIVYFLIQYDKDNQIKLWWLIRLFFNWPLIVWRSYKSELKRREKVRRNG